MRSVVEPENIICHNTGNEYQLICCSAYLLISQSVLIEQFCFDSNHRCNVKFYLMWYQCIAFGRMFRYFFLCYHAKKQLLLTFFQLQSLYTVDATAQNLGYFILQHFQIVCFLESETNSHVIGQHWPQHDLLCRF